MQSLICIYFYSLVIFFVQIQAQEHFWIPLPGFGTKPTTTTTTAKPTNDLNTQFELSLNTYRAIHGAGALKFNATLQAEAKVCADGYAAGTFTPITLCKPTGDYYQEWSPSTPEEPLPDPAFLAQATADAWYAESAALVFPGLSYIPETYHVRQMLWKATSQFGCAVSVPTTPANNVFVLCVYNPVGNVEVLVGSDTPPTTFPTTDLVANVQAPAALK